ncbi:MAG: outer membrane protein transport protein [Pseudodesulfovibrio sp.]
MKRASVLVFCGLFVCLMASASVVQAGGFALYEWGARGTAMATTGYAQAGDASIIATNPALMTKLEGKHVLVGATVISPQTSVYLDGNKNKTEAKKFVVPHAYYTQQMESNENVWFGVGVFTRFGLGTYYDPSWEGRTSLVHVDIQSVSVNPNVAFKFDNGLSMAVGVEVMRGAFDLKKDATSLGGSEVQFKTSGYGVGGNLGLTYDISDEWTTAFAYRSPIKLFTSGSSSGDAVTQVLDTENNQDIFATLPSSYTVGVAYKPIEEWVLEFDTIYTRWELTDKLSYGGEYTATTPLHYKNTWRFQLGTEYWAKEWLAVRFGYSYDQTPTRAGDASFMLPANDRQLFSTGLGYKDNGLVVDWSFMYVITKERNDLTINDPGGTDWNVDFKDGQTWITGLSVGYEF